MMKFIKIRGVREHNLKNVNLDIPKNKLVVFTGISGSGKSSLAFDTIYAEGQRRYVESLSAYARQFLGMMDKPDVDKIEGLPPAISIDQKSTSHNPRSTVGTITEIYDYLRLLFARVGHPHCPQCGREISSLSVQQIVDQVLITFSFSQAKSAQSQRGTRLLVLAPVVKDRKGEYSKLFKDLKRRGFSRVRVDGVIHSLMEDFVLIKTNRHTIDVLIDRLVLPGKLTQAEKKSLQQRLAESVETALKLGEGSVILSEVQDASYEFPENPEKMSDHLFSEFFACPDCNISLPAIEPRSFSFNSPHGACPSCSGLGTKLEIDPQRIINPKLSINEGGIFPWSSIGEIPKSWLHDLLSEVAETYHFSLNVPIGNFSPKQRDILLYGSDNQSYRVRHQDPNGHHHEYWAYFEGVIPNLKRRYQQTESDYVRSEIEKYMIGHQCEACQGTRLRPEARSVTIGKLNIAEVSKLPVEKVKEWVRTFEKTKTNSAINQSDSLVLSSREHQIATPIIKELTHRLQFLIDVGLDYLTIDRAANTLSGGETQRIRLASQIGSGLSNVLYVLDEPSIGLHPRDQGRLLKTLKKLQDIDNSVIVVEHDPQTIQAADYVFDFGPGAGQHGGEIVAQGTPEQIAMSKKSLTGLYLSGRRKVEVEKMKLEEGKNGTQGRRLDRWKVGELETQVNGPNLKPSNYVTNPPSNCLALKGARENNLKNIDVSFPLGKFICLTGVSGSGKSTLLMEILYKRLALQFYSSREVPGKHESIHGVDLIDKVVDINQSPIGRTPRSNSATYTSVFTSIRELFSQTPEAKARGYSKGRFSFNVKGGRCENCQGDGQIKIEMQFLPDVYVDCEVCQGRRFNRETLEVDYKGKTVADVLDMSVEEALNFFQNIPNIRNKLQTLSDVGLSYIKLGQSAPTLSGGEAQRIKLAAELSKRSTGKTLFLLDEPTTGLHPYDIEKLLNVLHRLVRERNTVIVIEHNLDVIKTADWIIDLGPEGGEKGGYTVAEGTVCEIMENRESYTGQYLKQYLT